MARTNVSIRVEKGRDPEEVWALHVSAALLENRCPQCYGPLLDGNPDRPGWFRCRWNSYPHGWWRRTGGGYEWQLGLNPFTGEYEWRP